MKFSEEKKRAIKKYILEKINQEEESLSKVVSEAFDINQNTVYTYIDELIDHNIIKKLKRGKYELVKTEYRYTLTRNNGDLYDDTAVYMNCLYKHVKNFESNVEKIWSYAFSEMINNVIDHSFAENVTVLISQDYSNTNVAIIDNGIGIFKKIKEHFNFPTIDEAICELFKGKLTTDSKNHSGEGIFFTSKLMDEFFILSDGKIFTSNKFDNGFTVDFGIKDVTGTCVYMSLSNYTHKKPQDIFNEYSNVDGGFTKTRIPLRNIFDASPVSRSQAKRICYRLEKFNEISLDFDEIEWMGQGFAHQLFVVFQSEHPDIKITPENMNEDVEKMYKHVISAN